MQVIQTEDLRNVHITRIVCVILFARVVRIVCVTWVACVLCIASIACVIHAFRIVCDICVIRSFIGGMFLRTHNSLVSSPYKHVPHVQYRFHGTNVAVNGAYIKVYWNI